MPFIDSTGSIGKPKKHTIPKKILRFRRLRDKFRVSIISDSTTRTILVDKPAAVKLAKFILEGE